MHISGTLDWSSCNKQFPLGGQKSISDSDSDFCFNLPAFCVLLLGTFLFNLHTYIPLCNVNPNKFRILKTFVETDYLKVFE